MNTEQKYHIWIDLRPMRAKKKKKKRLGTDLVNLTAQHASLKAQVELQAC